MLCYYRGRWPDAEVPPDRPVWLHYEVDSEVDNVLRTVDLFADGHIDRNSVALEERDGFSCPSLVDAPFLETVAESGLQPISPAEFEALWQKGKDKPFWNVG